MGKVAIVTIPRYVRAVKRKFCGNYFRANYNVGITTLVFFYKNVQQNLSISTESDNRA